MLASMDVDRYRSPRKKLLRFFVGSRDGWKAKCGDCPHLRVNENGTVSFEQELSRLTQKSLQAKCAEANEDRKLLANQVRALEKSREQWRTLADERKRLIGELERELAELKRAAD